MISKATSYMFHAGLRIYLEPYLEWNVYGLGDRMILAGAERYPQMVWAIQVKPNVLETDPGPLDARVP